MKPNRALLAIYTDRDLLRLALERMTESEYVCGFFPWDEEDSRLPSADCVPDVVILDHPNGVLEKMSRLSARMPGVPFVAWQRSDASEPSLHALDKGARGVLNDNSSAADVLECVNAVRAGRAWVPPSISQAALVSRRCRLSRREGQLINLVSQGLRNKEIAWELKISEGTVKVYFSRLFDKLGVSDRYELALLGLRHSAQGPSGPPALTSAGNGVARDTLNAVFVCKSNSALPAPRTLAAPPPVSVARTGFSVKPATPGRLAGTYGA